MLSKLFDQFFGRFKRERREVIKTRTLIEPKSNSMDNTNLKVNELSDSDFCVQPLFSMSGTNISSNTEFHNEFALRNEQHTSYQQSSKQQQKQTRTKDDCSKLSDISIFNGLLLFITLFVFLFTIAILLFVYVNRTIQLSDSLKSEFVTRSDIDEIIRNLLKDLRQDDDKSFNIKPDNNDQIERKILQSIDANKLR